MGFQSFIPAHDFHQKTSAVKFWNLLFFHTLFKKPSTAVFLKTFRVVSSFLTRHQEIALQPPRCLMGLYFTALFQPGMRSLKRLSLKSSKGWCGRTVWWRTVPQTQKKAKMTTCINTVGKGATFSLFHWLNPKCLGSVQSNKVFLYGQTNESRVFLWKNCFWRTFLVLRGFFCQVLVFLLSLLPHGRLFISKEKYPIHSLCIMSVTPGNLPWLCL